ncbi:helix-turn-helix domain-containing protein [Aerococcus tenax]|uniref:Helix-turn-helix domain-containing protein n=1 Tax=Aerococcus tenax TaxID=3078812 RepID=A0A5N1BQT5_9LACT|nr:helix-turn-helix domain-containing protein [Aerococcus urinae]KAA9239973.1 helix-turn-helix domain-containing protein [Aerococcus urinae]MDK6689645.1 helix-turn-helix domain-containing protein [Aerococcus urinae]
MSNQSLGNRLRVLRKEKGLTMVQLGKIIDAPQSAISQWENGINQPNRDRLKKLADLYQISVNELLHGTQKEIINSFDLISEQALKEFTEIKSANGDKLSQSRVNDLRIVLERMKKEFVENEIYKDTRYTPEFIKEQILNVLQQETWNGERNDFGAYSYLKTLAVTFQIKIGEYLGNAFTIEAIENGKISDSVILEFKELSESLNEKERHYLKMLDNLNSDKQDKKD